ncbi:hypothetical protein CL630_00070 [bacterium]|nr:hypothetical protein [bacterium]|tara:strand:- start:1026 stop:2375 length:1350 start_codon:yes stop_codon:yes gene_type:complete
MPKRILQDVISPRSRSKETTRSGDTTPKESARRAEPLGGASRVERSGFFRGRNQPLRPVQNESDGNSTFIIWGIAAVAILVVLFSIFSLFEKATIKVTPKQQIATINTQLSAQRGTATTGGLVFEIMTLAGEEKKTIPATQVERVDQKSSGKIIVYNNFNSKSQKLVKRTRFETPEGLIYRIRDSVVVPGQKTTGGEKTPGSIEVTVYADGSGEEYNVGLTDFTIPGFKGSPRFDSFYARSKTPMIGGFSGVVKTVSDKQLESAEQDLASALRGKLIQKASSQKPDSFVLYDDAIFFSLDGDGAQAIQTDVNKDEVDVVVSGTLHSIIFNKNTLSQFLANILISNVRSDDNITVQNLDVLEFAVSNKELFSPTENTMLSFVMQGNPHLVWQFDEVKLKQDTLAKSKDEFKEVLANYSSIQKAEVILRPFWRRSFPDVLDKIKIETVIEE